jgi:hypothetical protein
MSVSLSSDVHPFVTGFTAEEIESNEQNLKDIEIVYLHVDRKNIIGNNTTTIDKIFVGIQKIENRFTKFCNVKRCLIYLRKTKHNKIYLILLKALCKKTMLALNKYAQVMFVFQFDLPDPWIKEEYIPNGSQSSDALLSQLLCARHRLLYPNISPSTTSIASLELSSQELTEDSRSFILYQLLMEVLLRIPNLEEIKKDFIDWFLMHHSTNPKDKEAIDLFASTFQPNQAIMWYTNPSFVYRILGRTFATNNIRFIFTIRYFICHLYRELKDLHEKTFAILDPRICVYRGKTMSISDFDKLKASIGKLVIIKCFLSASLDKDVALAFAGEQEVAMGNVAVIFRMKINKFANRSKPFAFVGEKSNIKDKAEFLLAPGIIFRNQRIKKLEVC